MAQNVKAYFKSTKNLTANFWTFDTFEQEGWNLWLLKGALSGLKQFLATESPLKMMKNAYFTSKALLILKIFKFLSLLFGHVLKWLDQKDKVNLKFYDATAWLTNYFNTHSIQYIKK